MKSTSRNGCLFDNENKVPDFSGPLWSVTMEKKLRHKKKNWFAFNAKDFGDRWFHENLFLTPWCKKMHQMGAWISSQVVFTICNQWTEQKIEQFEILLYNFLAPTAKQ